MALSTTEVAMAHQAPFRWTPVPRDAEPRSFPGVPAAARAALSGPAVYRWRVEPSCDPAMFWLGETGSLDRTLEEIAYGTTARGVTWRRRLEEERALGATVRLEVLAAAGPEVASPEGRRRLLAEVAGGMRRTGAVVELLEGDEHGA